MPERTLDYQMPVPLADRKSRFAAALNRISWLILGLSVVGIVGVYLLMAGRSGDPYAHMVQQFSDEDGPMLNVMGAAVGMAGGLLGNRWSGLVGLLHILQFGMWPSIGFS